MKLDESISKYMKELPNALWSNKQAKRCWEDFKGFDLRERWQRWSLQIGGTPKRQNQQYPKVNNKDLICVLSARSHNFQFLMTRDKAKRTDLHSHSVLWETFLWNEDFWWPAQNITVFFSQHKPPANKCRKNSPQRWVISEKELALELYEYVINFF